MRKAGYPEGRSVGLLAPGGHYCFRHSASLPPILIGVMGNISIKNLFFGGIVPPAAWQ